MSSKALAANLSPPRFHLGGSAGGSVTKARGGGSRQGRLRRLRPPRCAKARTRAAHASQRGSSKRHDIVNPLRPRRRRAQVWRTVAAGGRRPQAAAGGHPPQAAVHVFSVYEREWGHPSSLVVLHRAVPGGSCDGRNPGEIGVDLPCELAPTSKYPRFDLAIGGTGGANLKNPRCPREPQPPTWPRPTPPCPLRGGCR